MGVYATPQAQAEGERLRGAKLGNVLNVSIGPMCCIVIFVAAEGGNAIFSYNFRTTASSQSSQQLKFTTSDSCDRIKDEFQFLQAQYHSSAGADRDEEIQQEGFVCCILPEGSHSC
ncbi:hypothetical protein JZ751_014218 [Albula glossodonta]|uniref:Groucho/TLE N-terminal Q-rich domain-containing protein n=1 Tax=Albula glossodonta TaxID=121402 RepID=A0A8T2NSQ7_9TELE|nr:hypothetical protein JZ751_014218 [Albula glossodonta]